MEKVLITGGAGLLGRYLTLSGGKNYMLYVTFYNTDPSRKGIEKCHFQKLNILDKGSLNYYATRIKPDVIIHTASVSDIDYCEKNKNQVWETNVVGTKNIIEVAKKIKARVVFLSTSSIFDGKLPYYHESSKANPLNYYGKTKLEAESYVQHNYERHLIVRLTTMYGLNNPGERTNPALWVIGKLTKNESVKAVTDAHTNYLYAGQAADVIWKIIQSDKVGEIYHIGGKECISRYSFFRKVVKQFNLNSKLLIPVRKDLFPDLAPRPSKILFVTKKIQDEFSYKACSTDMCLKKMAKEYYELSRGVKK